MELTSLVIGDCHFKPKAMVAVQRMAAAILQVAQKRRPDFIVLLGDTLDQHETVHSIVHKEATKFIRELSLVAPVYLIIGNHDRPNNSDFLSPDHHFTPLHYVENVTVVDKVLYREIKERKFIFVPYVPPGRFHEALATLPHDYHGVTAIFAHQEFRGAKMGAIESIQGDVWPLEEPYVISGHIHDYDELQANILYTGTPMQHAFGDKEDKTISFFTFGEVRCHERIDLQLPKKRLLHLSCQQVLNLDSASFNPDDETKIVITGTAAEIKTLRKMQIIKDLKALGVKECYKETREDIATSGAFAFSSGTSYYEKLTMAVSSEVSVSQLLRELFGPCKSVSGT